MLYLSFVEVVYWLEQIIIVFLTIFMF